MKIIGIEKCSGKFKNVKNELIEFDNLKVYLGVPAETYTSKDGSYTVSEAAGIRPTKTVFVTIGGLALVELAADVKNDFTSLVGRECTVYFNQYGKVSQVKLID